MFELSPAVPLLDLDQRTDPRAVANPVRLAAVVTREPVDVGQVRVLPPLDDATADRYVGVPGTFLEGGQADHWVLPHIRIALPARVHVHQDPAVVGNQIPGSDRDRLPVRPHDGDHRWIGLDEQGHGLVGQRRTRHVGILLTSKIQGTRVSAYRRRRQEVVTAGPILRR